MENFKDDDFTKFQPYMMEKSLQQARMSFKVRCQMVETIKGNFKAKQAGAELCQAQDKFGLFVFVMP